MQAILLVVHVLLALSLVGLVLLQRGKGAEVGASFGSGASGTVFGARGSASFLTKLTTMIAIAFFASSLGLAYLSARQPEDASLLDKVNSQQTVISEPAPADSGNEKIEQSSQTPEDVPILEEQK